MRIRFLKPCFYFVLAVGLVAALFLSYRVYTLLTKPMILAGAPLIIEVKPGSTANALIETLYSKKLIESKRLYLNFIHYKKLANKIKAGVYQVLPGESALQLLDRIIAGDVLTLTFRIIEGSNLSQVSTNLQKAPYLTFDKTDWIPIAGTHSNAEGLLLADTYKYNAGSDAKHLLLQANKKLLHYLDESWQNRSPGLPYKTPYDLLIVASILEKEAALPNEKKLISGVVVNRLLKNMPLQMDPTVIYGLAEQYTGKLRHADLANTSPYNTYIYRGLVPTPIAMVGKDAIDAAAHPEASNYLYFVAKGDGSHVFSETYLEQRKAISHYMFKGS